MTLTCDGHVMLLTKIVGCVCKILFVKHKTHSNLVFVWLNSNLQLHSSFIISSVDVHTLVDTVSVHAHNLLSMGCSQSFVWQNFQKHTGEAHR
jgi:hypothetical protein